MTSLHKTQSRSIHSSDALESKHVVIFYLTVTKNILWYLQEYDIYINFVKLHYFGPLLFQLNPKRSIAFLKSAFGLRILPTFTWFSRLATLCRRLWASELISSLSRLSLSTSRSDLSKSPSHTSNFLRSRVRSAVREAMVLRESARLSSSLALDLMGGDCKGRNTSTSAVPRNNIRTRWTKWLCLMFPPFYKDDNKTNIFFSSLKILSVSVSF